MNAEEYLTTDALIERINQLPKVFAIRSDLYGIDIYADREEYRDDDKDCRWFMTVDPKAKLSLNRLAITLKAGPKNGLILSFGILLPKKRQR